LIRVPEPSAARNHAFPCLYRDNCRVVYVALPLPMASLLVADGERHRGRP